MLLDSNIVIYAAEPQYQTVRDFIARNQVAVSIITHVEVLGFIGINQIQEQKLRRILNTASTLPTSEKVVLQAIKLRQQSRMKLGDSLIASTAIVYGLPLATHNVVDFNWIGELTVVDPLM